jgi:mRNA interferase RelE/StbE
MQYSVSVLPPAAKQLAKLDPQIRKRVAHAITALAENPRPPGSKKLVGVDAWRIRMGDWRIIYQIHDDRLIVLVMRIGHRRDVYEK